jgi:hypothetical protein
MNHQRRRPVVTPNLEGRLPYPWFQFAGGKISLEALPLKDEIEIFFLPFAE